MNIGKNDFKTQKEIQHFTNLLYLAEAIATVAHENQMDKTGIPYIYHPKAVSGYCTTTYAKIVGWLHDVIEDTPVTLDDLQRLGFDDFLLEALDCVTKAETGYDEANYYERIKHNPLAKEVKLADLKHNTDPSRIPDDTDPELKKYLLQKHEHYFEHIKYLSED